MAAVTPDGAAGERGRLRAMGLVAFGLALLLVVVADLKSHRDLEAARASEAELEERIAETRERIRRLAERRDLLLGDPATLERLAREELAMARPGDLVLILPEPPATPAAAGVEPAPPTE